VTVRNRPLFRELGLHLALLALLAQFLFTIAHASGAHARTHAALADAQAAFCLADPGVPADGTVPSPPPCPLCQAQSLGGPIPDAAAVAVPVDWIAAPPAAVSAAPVPDARRARPIQPRGPPSVA
jgi:hypothetical protein